MKLKVTQIKSDYSLPVSTFDSEVDKFWGEAARIMDEIHVDRWERAHKVFNDSAYKAAMALTGAQSFEDEIVYLFSHGHDEIANRMLKENKKAICSKCGDFLNSYEGETETYCGNCAR